MVKQIYQSELQLNEANSSDTKAPFLDLHLTISDSFVSFKNYDKHDDFDFDIVNFPLAGLRASHVFVCAFVFARVCFCPFSLPLGVGGWLRFVIVALPGLVN